MNRFAIAMISVMISSVAGATNLWTSYQGCTSTNCGASIIRGTLLQGGSVDAFPWVAQIYAGSGECVRLDVLSVSGFVDLEMVVISPEGSIYRNDDRSSNDKPLVKIRQAPNNGWYTVILSEWSGEPVDNSDFLIAYGRYSRNNPNCYSPTTPQSQDDPSVAKPPRQQSIPGVDKHTKN